MANNKHLITRGPADPGTAAALADVNRRLQKLEGNYGVVGAGATITGPVIQTADSNPKVWIQGTTGPGATAGLFGTDSSGGVVISLIPGQGLSVEAFYSTTDNPIPAGVNCVSWYDGTLLVSEVVGVHVNSGTGNQGIVSSRAFSPDGNYMSRYYANAISGVGSAVYATAGTPTSQTQQALLIDSNGNHFVYTSDESLKEIIGGLETPHLIHQLRPVKYHTKDSHTVYEQVHYGFVAQEVEKVLPELVRDMPAPELTIQGDDLEVQEQTPLKGISLPSLVALMVAAIQVQEERIKDLENKWNKKS